MKLLFRRYTPPTVPHPGDGVLRVVQTSSLARKTSRSAWHFAAGPHGLPPPGLGRGEGGCTHSFLKGSGHTHAGAMHAKNFGSGHTHAKMLIPMPARSLMHASGGIRMPGRCMPKILPRGIPMPACTAWVLIPMPRNLWLHWSLLYSLNDFTEIWNTFG